MFWCWIHWMNELLLVWLKDCLHTCDDQLLTVDSPPTILRRFTRFPRSHRWCVRNSFCVSLTYDSGSKSRLLVSDNAAIMQPAAACRKTPIMRRRLFCHGLRAALLIKSEPPASPAACRQTLLKGIPQQREGGTRRSNRIASDDCKHPSALCEFTLFRLYFQASNRFFPPCIVFLCFWGRTSHWRPLG